VNERKGREKKKNPSFVFELKNRKKDQKFSKKISKKYEEQSIVIRLKTKMVKEKMHFIGRFHAGKEKAENFFFSDLFPF